MANLSTIGMSGLAKLAPTPVQQYVIKNYLANSELLNALAWTNIGLGSNLGNFIASVVVSDGSIEAVGRLIGEEYTPDNEELRTETYQLKILGGSILTDVEVERAFKNTMASVATNYTQTQIEIRLNAIEKCFAKWFITGNSSTRPKEFDGINKFLSEKASSQVISTSIDISALNEDKAFEADKRINEAIALMGHEPSFILTSRKASGWLSTLNRYSHRGVEAIEYNDKRYSQYNGIPIVRVDDSCFAEEDMQNKFPIYFIYTSTVEGVRVAYPADGSLMLIQLPNFNNGTGNVTAKGTCELMCVPIFEKYSVAKCFITDTAAASSK